VFACFEFINAINKAAMIWVDEYHARVFWSAVTTGKYTGRLSCFFFLVYYSSSTVDSFSCPCCSLFAPGKSGYWNFHSIRHQMQLVSRSVMSCFQM
jgi:hypothetical protein